MTPKTATINLIESFLLHMFPDPTAIVEIFGIHGLARIKRFVHRDKRKCAIAAWQMSIRYGLNVYWMTSPVNPASIYADSVDNCIINDPLYRAGEHDIARRTHIVIDLDPAREPGTAATEEQRHDAQDAATHMTAKMCLTYAWPFPTTVSSGNGYQLIYDSDLPARCSLIKTLWAALAPEVAENFGVVIDCSVSKAAQLARVPGLLNLKANRLAELTCVPDHHQEGDDVVDDAKLLDTLDAMDIPLTKYDLMEAGDAWTPALDADGVIKLIEAYPDVLSVNEIAESDGVTKFFLSECPCAGKTHRGDRHKTVICIGPEQFWFRCWSDDCAHFGLRDLRDVLAQTGRTPPPFWLAPQGDEDLWDNVVEVQPDLVIDTVGPNKPAEQDADEDVQYRDDAEYKDDDA